MILLWDNLWYMHDMIRLFIKTFNRALLPICKHLRIVGCCKNFETYSPRVLDNEENNLFSCFWNYNLFFLLQMILVGTINLIDTSQCILLSWSYLKSTDNLFIFFSFLFNYQPSSRISSCVRTVYTVMCLHNWPSLAICFRAGSDLGPISRRKFWATLPLLITSSVQLAILFLLLVK